MPIHRYNPKHLEINLIKGNVRDSWTQGGKSVSGFVMKYGVVDAHFDRLNEWVFDVQIPNDDKFGFIVRPTTAPGKKIWADITRRSIIFNIANRKGVKDKLYCKISLADPSKEKTKLVLRMDEKELLTYWFKHLRGLTTKDKIATTKGSEGKTMVYSVRAGSYEKMIQIFFASKIWVLEKNYRL